MFKFVRSTFEVCKCIVCINYDALTSQLPPREIWRLAVKVFSCVYFYIDNINLIYQKIFGFIAIQYSTKVENFQSTVNGESSFVKSSSEIAELFTNELFRGTETFCTTNFFRSIGKYTNTFSTLLV